MVVSVSLVQKTYTREQLVGTPVCGDNIPEVKNATWAYASRDGSVLTYTCDVGFVTSRGLREFNYTCKSTGSNSLTPLPDRCSIVQCPHPGPIDHSTLDWKAGPAVRFGSFGDIVEYTCFRGYTGDGKAHGPKVVKKICDENGQYEFVLSTITSCMLIHCDAPLALRNALIDPAIDRTVPVAYNQSVSYTCGPGFTSASNDPSNGFTLTCGDDGEYVPNDPLPRCKAVTCAAPPVLPYAATIHVAGSVPIGTRLLYRCTDGFVVSVIPASSTFNVMCELIKGVPQYVIPPPEKQCKASACLPLPELDNAHVVDGRTAWRYQEVARFECDNGYALGSVKGATAFDGYCNTQGLWTLQDNPKCSKVICAAGNKLIPPGILEYARLVPFIQEPIKFGMNTTVQCVSGAVVTGTNQRSTRFDLKCGPDGDFQSSGICAIPCAPIPKVAHSVSAYFGQTLEFGQPAATIKCKPGFITKSGKRVQDVICSRDGNLTPIEECVSDLGYSGQPGYGQPGYGGYNISEWGLEGEWQYQTPQPGLLDAEILRRSSQERHGMTLAVVTTVFSFLLLA